MEREPVASRPRARYARAVFPARALLWIDCGAALLAGALMFALGGWLSELYLLPRSFLALVASVNVALSLALRARRPRALLLALVLGNAAWAAACGAMAFAVAGRASAFGVAHLVLEGLFVGGLARLEWRAREGLLAPG